MKTCYSMNIIVKTTCGDESSLNGKSEIPNNTLANITRALLLNSSQKKELWCFAYKCAIWLSRRTESRLCGDVTYFLWKRTRPSYKHIKYGIRESTSPMDMLQEIILMIGHIEVISWGIQILQELLYTRNYINHLLFTDLIMFGLMDIILASPYKTSTPQVTYSFVKILRVIFMIQNSYI